MKYSVSACCLNQDEFKANVLAVIDYPIADLHCDVFPELEGAPSIAPDQLEWCVQAWPRQLTVHIWGRRGLTMLPAEAPDKARLVVQLDGNPDVALVHDAITAGWVTGISIVPHLVHLVTEPHGIPFDYVQLVTTSTPGFPGGSFTPSAPAMLDRLVEVRTARQERWAIEIDGGLTSASLAAVRGQCDLAVLGSHLLRATDEGLLEPVPSIREISPEPRLG